MEDVRKEIIDLNVKKSSLSKANKATSLKMHIHQHILTNSINNFFIEKKFAYKLKQSVDIPLYKSLDLFFKKNERPVSLVLYMNVWKRIMVSANSVCHITWCLHIYIVLFIKVYYCRIYTESSGTRPCHKDAFFQHP